MAVPFLQGLDPLRTDSLGGAQPSMPGMDAGPTILTPQYNDARLLAIFEQKKKEAFESRWVWEREWLRDIFYVVGRQWIYWHPTRREWIDKRLQKNLPRPVTNKMAEILQALRASFQAIDIGVIGRPIGNSSRSIATAEIADKIAPLIHDEHRMDQVLREANFWFLTNGNAALQMSWDTDKRFNRQFIQFEQCLQCKAVLSPQDIVQANGMCPRCLEMGVPSNTQFQPALRPDNQPAGEWIGLGRGKTTALSPFEYAFPSNVTSWDDLPYIIRLRWRDKAYYEANLPELASKLSFERSPQDRSLQIYKSLALTNDIGHMTHYGFMAGGGNQSVEGITEYELWLKPTPEFPQGMTMRVAGDHAPILVHAEDEGIPGPFQYKDIEDQPIFPFAHAQFEHIGGRLYGRSVFAPLIQKQDQINQLDSIIQMHLQRMANPVWIVPEGAGIDHFTGDPGLVVKWNPLAAGGTAKPERIEASRLGQEVFALRAQYLQDLEELSGAFDVLRGAKPSGDVAFSALQLLVERSQARFTSAFAAWGNMYRSWYTAALELERQFGPQQRILTLIGPNKGYMFKQFERAQLQGSIDIHIEDGTQTPKTPLGRRAAIEHANQLGLLIPSDPDQQHALLTELGLAHLAPGLDIHVQAALHMQDSFERWFQEPIGPSPLVVKPWHNVQIHWNERIKWLNTDHMRELLAQSPDAEQLVIFHLQELQMALAPPPLPEESSPDGGIGAGRAMRNSNRNAGSPTIGAGTVRPEPVSAPVPGQPGASPLPS